MPDIEFQPQIPLVRALLRSQLPPDKADWAEEPLAPLAQGWDNVLYKLGETHVVRLPVRRQAATQAEHEIAWVNEAADPLVEMGILVPLPEFAGRPDALFPWRWTIVPWIPGQDVSQLPVADRGRLPGQLARALAALHRPAPQDAPYNPFRSDLASRATAVADRWPSVHQFLGADVTASFRAHWRRALAAPGWPFSPRWVHGDCHPHNLIQVEGHLVGIIDFGDVSGGDPAVDLATGWLTFDAGQRDVFRRSAEETGRYDDAVWDRAIGWALVIVTALISDPASRHSFGPLIDHVRAQLA